jgi:nitrilase
MPRSYQKDKLTVGLAQIAPAWLNRNGTMAKILGQVRAAGEAGCHIVAFGEGLLPGYPFWIERTNGAIFNSPMQKEMHAHYMDQAVQIEAGHLDELCDTAKQMEVTVVLGCIERPMDRGGHSLYASLVYIDSDGEIQSVHRKLMPTYEERLTWSPGDGHGLRVHQLGAFTVGGLNCWENWMPLARAALYGQGEDLHIAIWPGDSHLTSDVTRFIAMESRSFVISVSGLMRSSDFQQDTPYLSAITSKGESILSDGGSCIAGPDGKWIVEPLIGEEKLIIATIDHHRVREERQNFDPSGHYSRPDVLRLSVNRQRQSAVTFDEN